MTDNIAFNGCNIQRRTLINYSLLPNYIFIYFAQAFLVFFYHIIIAAILTVQENLQLTLSLTWNGIKHLIVNFRTSVFWRSVNHLVEVIYQFWLQLTLISVSLHQPPFVFRRPIVLQLDRQWHMFQVYNFWYNEMKYFKKDMSLDWACDLSLSVLMAPARRWLTGSQDDWKTSLSELLCNNSSNLKLDHVITLNGLALTQKLTFIYIIQHSLHHFISDVHLTVPSRSVHFVILTLFALALKSINFGLINLFENKITNWQHLRLHTEL